MKLIRQLYFMVSALALLLQLAGCASGQEVPSGAEFSFASESPSSTAASAQSSAQSSSVAPQSARFPDAGVQPESAAEASQGQEQLPSSAEQPLSSPMQSAVLVEPQSALRPPAPTSLPEETKMNHVSIEAGGKTFSATLADNEAARAFAAYLPMTVQMSELNGQEKFYNLPDNLPSNSAERPPTIQSGDIFCWSGNTLVLFYSTFQNSYGGYVRLGTVDDPTGLAAALGSGSAKVTWALTQ